jgi:uncharacterized delta-60 repeat protein
MPSMGCLHSVTIGEERVIPDSNFKHRRRISTITAHLRTRFAVEALERRLLLSTATVTADASLLADASVRNDLYANTNFGAASTLLVENTSVSGDEQITFIKFNISSVGAVSAATLELNASLENSGDPAVSVGVFGVPDNSWTQGTGSGTIGVAANGITWNNQPSIGPMISGAKATISSQKAHVTDFNITSYIQAQKLLGNNEVSLVIESLTKNTGTKAGAGIVQFDSSHGAVAPALSIVFTPAAPKATLTAGNVTSAAAHETVVAEYTGQVPIDLTSIVGGSKGNLQISGPSVATIGAVTVNSANPDDVFATYTINPPGTSAWANADNGTYTVTLGNDQVKDSSGNSVASTATSFTVNVPIPDTTPPAVTISAAPVTSATFAPEQIVVVYKDNRAVAASTIASSNITVTGPAGPLAVQSVTQSSSTNAPSITATYSVTPLSGGWSYANNGSYTVALVARSVTDAAGNGVRAASANFTVNIPTPADPNDVTFDHGSSVTAPFTAEASAVLSNDDVVIVGEQSDASTGNSQGVIELFNADGTVATGFGDNGMIVTPASANEAFNAVLAQGTSFVVAGSGDGFLLQRYDISGQLDGTFGTAGSVVTTFGAANQAVYSLAQGANGDIVAGGTSGGNFAFADYDTNGNLVTTFGQSGRQLFDVGNPTGVVGAIAFQSDGDLIAVGSSGSQVIVARLNTAGNADDTFGNAGLVIVPGLVANISQPIGDHTEGLAIEPDDSILVAHQTANGDFGVVHLDANGNLITSFGNNGLATASVGTDDDADAVFLQPDGDIIVAGTTGAAGETAVAAFDQNGALIPGFGLLGGLSLPAPVGAGGGSSSSGDPSVFAAQTSDGQLILGTGEAASSSIVRELDVAGTKSMDAGTPLGSFSPGATNRLSFTIDSNTKVTLSITGGAGEAFLAANGLHLVITAAARGAALTIALKGGSRRVSLGDVTVSGTLRSLVNKSVDLAGTLSATGAIDTLSIGNVTGGTIAAGSAINSVSMLSASDAHILAGANLGADGELGGTGTDADTFSPGFIRALRVTGSLTSSIIAAGVDPTDGIYLAADDTLLGGTASFIRSVYVRNIDQSTRFLAGAFKTASIPKTVKPASDSHFEIL